MHEYRGHRAASFVHARLQHRAARRRVRIGLQLAQIGDQQNCLEQFINALLLLRGNFHKFRVAAPLGGNQVDVGELPLHAFRLRFRLVDLVDRDDDRNLGGPRVIDGFFRLRHDAVVGGHDKHNDVRDLCAARAHARERLVARRIHKNHAAVVHHHFVGADVLRDSAGFASGSHIRFANRVEQARLAVVHMPHDGDDGRPRLQTFLGLFLGDFEHHLFFKRNDAHDSAERFRERRRRRHVERLVDAGEYPSIEQRLQKIFRAHIELFRKFADRDAFRDRDFARRPRFRRRNNGRSRSAIACSRTLARWMQLALTLLLPLVHDRPLSLGRFAGIERLARFRLRRHFVRRQRR